jgi:hypothetical protein
MKTKMNRVSTVIRKRSSDRQNPEALPSLWVAPLAFISLALLFCEVGYLLPEVSRALGGILWLVTIWMAGDRRRWLWIVLYAILLFNPYGAVHRSEGLWLLAMLPWAGGVWRKRWMGATFLAVVGCLIWSYLPTYWVPWDNFIAGISSNFTSANLSAPAAGIPLFGLMVCFALATILTERKTKAPIFILLAALGALMAYWWLQTSLGSWLFRLGSRSLMDSVSLQWVLLLLLAIILFVWGWMDKPKRESSPKRRSWLMPALCLLGLSLVAMPPRIGAPSMNKSVVFYNKGHLNWDLPKYGFYGKHAGGMFGLVPEFLRWKGFKVEQADSITMALLERSGVLVFINLQDDLSGAEEAEITRFVEAGGSVLLLGDHTGLSGIREPSNRLLKPFGIELNFDSAKPSRTGWAGSLAAMHHPILPPQRLDRDGKTQPGSTQIWVGASLGVKFPAYPVIIGREGFSDLGNPTNERDGYLGDFVYHVNERLGNLVLVAENRYGRGKVLIFGDTSTIQNGALVRAADFVQRIMLYLLSPVQTPVAIWKILGILFILVGIISWGFQKASEFPLALTAILLFVGVIIGERRTSIPLTIQNHQWLSSAWQRAIIDHSHAPRSPMNQTSIDGHWGLQNCLMRSEFMPITLSDWDAAKLNDAKILIEMAPAKKFSTKEKRDIAQFMEQGGLVMVCCGAEEWDGSESLLQEYGLRPVYVPLGPAEVNIKVQTPPSADSLRSIDSLDIKVHFHKAWETAVANLYAQTKLEAFSKPVTVWIPKGKGGLLYFSDTDFLTNLNLESPTADPFEGNILYLRQVWKDYAGGK